MRDTLIRWLGGYTRHEWQQMQMMRDVDGDTIIDQRKTIAELQALIPVSAVTPKKRGRPRKVNISPIKVE